MGSLLRSFQLKHLAVSVTIGGVVCVGYYLLFRKKKEKRHTGVVVACTGFSKFNGVSANPTEVIVKNLPLFLKINPIEDPRICIDRCKIIEVLLVFLQFPFPVSFLNMLRETP
jgi:hypothetical protein